MDSKEEKGSFSTDPEPEDATKAPEKLTDFTANQICLVFSTSGDFKTQTHVEVKKERALEENQEM